MALTKVISKMVDPESASKTGVETLTNKTLDNTNTITIKDANLTIQDDVDVTKQVKLQVSGVTTATTRTLTVPDANTTIVGTDAVQTLTNKTLTSPAITTPTGIVKADVGLANVDNTSDATKNAAIATLTNKTFDADGIGNSITNIENADIKAAAGIALSKLAATTVSRALASDASGFVTASSTTSVELGYVAGATSAIQTQIDTKAPSSTAVTLAGVQVVTNKDIDGGTASNTSRLTLPKAAKTALDALTRKQGTILFDTTSNKPYYDDGTALQVVGSGSGGGVNFVTNPDAESGTTGWTVDSFAAATRPSGALTAVNTGVTFAATATTPLAGSNSFLLTKDAVNRQGRVVYTGITITPAYFAKVLQVSADYLVNSGTFVAGSSTTDSDVIFYLQNVTDGTFIEPSSFKLLSNSTTISDKFSATFQTGASATSYRLLMYVATASAAAYSLKLDNIAVSPSVYVYGTPITDWANETLTMSWITGATLTAKSRRVGDSKEYEGRIAISAAVTAAALTITLNNSIDTAKLSGGTSSKTPLGHHKVFDTGATEYSLGSIRYSSATVVQFMQPSVSGTAVVEAGNVTNAVPVTFGATDTIDFRFSVPIVGLSSSTQMSDSADARVCSAYGTLSGSLTAAVTDATITSVKDSHGGFTSSTYRVTVAGDYNVAVSLALGSAGTTASVYKNGVLFQYLTTVTAATQYSSGAVLVPNCIVGDTISVRSTITGTGATGSLSISRISGPSAIAATESVTSSHNSAAGASIPSGSDSVFTAGTKLWDSHGYYNGTSGVFKPEISGKFEVQAVMTFAAFSNVNSIWAYIYKNGSPYKKGAIVITAAVSATWSCSVAGKVDMLAGENIEIRVFQNSGVARSLSTSAVENWVEINRIGN